MGHAVRSLLLLLLAACGEERVCDATACLEVCEAQRRAAQALVPPGGELLSAYEYARLADLAKEYRQEGGLARGWGLVVCKGVERCEASPGVGPEVPLPPGAYVMELFVDGSAKDVSAVEMRVDCGGRASAIEGARVVPLRRASADVKGHPLLQFRSPLAGPTPATCRVVVKTKADPVRALASEFRIAGDGQASPAGR